MWRGLVLDVSQFLRNHPGGSFLIVRNLGEDITAWIAGFGDSDVGMPTHVHSTLATTLLLSMVAGAVRVSADEMMWGPGPTRYGRNESDASAVGGGARSPRSGGGSSYSRQLRLGNGGGGGRPLSDFRPPNGTPAQPAAPAGSRPNASIFSEWTLVARAVVAQSRNGSVVRLDFEHAQLSAIGAATEAANWCLSSIGRYVMVRVMLKDLDRHMRKLARREQRAAIAAAMHAAAKKAVDAMRTAAAAAAAKRASPGKSVLPWGFLNSATVCPQHPLPRGDVGGGGSSSDGILGGSDCDSRIRVGVPHARSLM